MPQNGSSRDGLASASCPSEQDLLNYYKDMRAAKAALAWALTAGGLVYLINGQDALRAGIAAGFWLLIGWYSSKGLRADPKTDTACRR